MTLNDIGVEPAIDERLSGKELAREIDSPAREIVDVNTLDYPQHRILSTEAKNQDV